MQSIRSRLLAWLIGSVVLAGAIQAAVLYNVALREANELFDYHMQQQALALRDQVMVLGDEEALVQADEDFEFVIQIWRADGERLYRSRPRSALPQLAALGFADLATPDGLWRTFGVQSRGRVIQVAQRMNVRRGMAADAALRTLVPLGIIVPLLAMLVWLGVARAMRPLDATARAVAARNASALDPLPAEPLPDELRPLIGALNGLLARLGESIAAQRAFIGDAAHELRSPLTALRLQAQLLERAGSESERAAAASALTAGIDRATHLVGQLLELASLEPDSASHRFTSVSLDALAKDAVAMQAGVAAERGVDLGLAPSEPVQVHGDAASLAILLRNLVDNAVRYTPPGGRVDVAVGVQDGAPVLSVSDTGPGIPAEDRERVFDRFYRVPGSGESGSGLGLAIARRIAELHAARITLADAPGGGLRASVAFPAAPQRTAP